MRAFAEAAAARESVNYERMIPEKEHERKKREAEIERSHEEERAQHEKNLAILNVEKKVAVANAKLRAIDEAIEDKEIDEKKEIPGVFLITTPHSFALLHKERPAESVELGETIGAKCTSACKAVEGGVSCSKLLLVDVHSKERPSVIHLVYAIIDKQSNSSLISSELADELGAVSPAERYYLTTCSCGREIKYRRRLTGVTVQSPTGEKSGLPTLIECDSIPNNKREIPTPEMVRRFPHLEEIASEIPPLDEGADIHLLIRRDAPELLKVHEFINGPKGGPWAQKLSLGWTVIRQMCLDAAGGPAHMLACRTNLRAANSGEPWKKIAEPKRYELVPCPNHFKIKESIAEPQRSTESDVFRTTREDNEVGLSCEDQKYSEIMETGVHKNELGNWEMPLPFRHELVKMPNNRSQAVSRLNGLIRTLR